MNVHLRQAEYDSDVQPAPIDPERLASAVLGLNVKMLPLCSDGSFLGLTIFQRCGFTVTLVPSRSLAINLIICKILLIFQTLFTQKKFNIIFRKNQESYLTTFLKLFCNNFFSTFQCGTDIRLEVFFSNQFCESGFLHNFHWLFVDVGEDNRNSL